MILVSNYISRRPCLSDRFICLYVIKFSRTYKRLLAPSNKGQTTTNIGHGTRRTWVLYCVKYSILSLIYVASFILPCWFTSWPINRYILKPTMCHGELQLFSYTPYTFCRTRLICIYDRWVITHCHTNIIALFITRIRHDECCIYLSVCLLCKLTHVNSGRENVAIGFEMETSPSKEDGDGSRTLL